MVSGLNWFACIVVVQALHSIEECYYELWKVYTPAQVISKFGGGDPAVNFAFLNVGVVMLLLVTYLYFRQRKRFTIGLACFWVVIELINGSNHLLHAWQTGGYFPGVYTAPLLLLTATMTAFYVYKQWNRAHIE